jgi:3',5'-nucleoside bisphosphate phosphatase
MKKADLHIHTIFSDGKLTPYQIIKEACRKDITAVGITDHDTMRGIPQALQAGRELKVEVVPGVELSTDFKGEEVHILGYYCRAENTLLKNTLAIVRMDRYNRIVKMLKRLKDLDIDLSLKDVLKTASGGESLGRPHLAEALCRKGVCITPREAFQRFLAKGKPAFVKRLKISAHFAIQIIRKSGGVAVLAHPGLYKRDSLIHQLRDHGLSGIEAFHPDHRLADCRQYCRIAQKYNLFVTGGSDFHSQGFGAVVVNYRCLQILKQLARV